MRKKTHAEYVAEIGIKNPNIEIVGEYSGNNNPILHRCKIDGYEWLVRPTNLLSGKGCPVCSGMKKKTQEEYIAEVLKMNPNIEVVGTYINAKTKILHRCKIDGHEWYVAPTSVLTGYGCPMCGGSMQKTHREYVLEVEKTNPNIEVVGNYINMKTPILHKCKIDKHEWYARPNSILQGSGCPMCKTRKARNKFAKKHSEYVSKLATINKDIIVLGQYINMKTQIKHKCLICGWEWEVTPTSLLYGHGCPQCNKCSKSNGEKIIADWLDIHNVSYKKQKTFDDCKDKKALRFDFYLWDYNILVEYNGIQHYKPVDYFGGKEGFKDVVRRDKIKKQYCKENNITLVTIPYFADVYEELESLHNLIKSQKNVAKEVAA